MFKVKDETSGQEFTSAPQCPVCGECTPVAAYGGMCCARALAATQGERVTLAGGDTHERDAEGRWTLVRREP